MDITKDDNHHVNFYTTKTFLYVKIIIKYSSFDARKSHLVSTVRTPKTARDKHSSKKKKIVSIRDYWPSGVV